MRGTVSCNVDHGGLPCPWEEEYGGRDPATFSAAYWYDLWEPRYYSLLSEYQLIQASLHELRNHHHVTVMPDEKGRFICTDCGWKGRESTYANS